MLFLKLKDLYVIGLGLFLLGIPLQAQAQLNIQSNPVFSTPTPGVQEVGPKTPPFKAEIKIDQPPDDYKLGAIDFDGNKFYNNWTVKRYLKPLYQKQGETLTKSELETVIKDINQSSKFKINAQLTPNPDTQETEVHLDILEQQPFQITGTFDNQGRPGIGMYRGGVQVTDDSLLGFGDKLSVQYVGSDDAHRIVANYNIPFNRRGGNLDFNYIFHQIDYDQDLTFRFFPQKGEDHAWVVTLSQPLDKKKVWTAYSSMLFRHVTIERDYREIIKGDPRPWTVGLIFNKPDKLGSTWINAASIQNFDWFGTDAKFWRARIDGKRVFNLPHSQKLVLRASAQFTPDTLPPVQQFPIGGEYSVRGYTEGLITADRGHFYSLEHYMPIPFLKHANPWLADRTQMVSFVDFGQAWLDKSNARYIGGISSQGNRTTLFDAGVGLRYRLNQYLQGFADMGFGLYNRRIIELGGQPTFRMHFGVRTDFLPKDYKKRG